MNDFPRFVHVSKRSAWCFDVDFDRFQKKGEFGTGVDRPKKWTFSVECIRYSFRNVAGCRFRDSNIVVRVAPAARPDARPLTAHGARVLGAQPRRTATGGESPQI